MSTKIWVIAGICLGLMLAVANDGLAKDTKVLLGEGVDAYSRVYSLPANTLNNTSAGTLFYADQSEPNATAYMVPVDAEPLDLDGDGVIDKVLLGYTAFSGSAWDRVLVRSINTDGSGAANHTIINGATLADLQAIDREGNGTTEGCIIALNAIGYGVTLYVADSYGVASWSPWPFYWHPGRAVNKVAVTKVGGVVDQLFVGTSDGGSAAVSAYNGIPAGYPPGGPVGGNPFYQDAQGQLTDLISLDSNNDGTTDNVLMAENPLYYGQYARVSCFYRPGTDPHGWANWPFYFYPGQFVSKLAVVKGGTTNPRLFIGETAYGGTFIDSYNGIPSGYPPYTSSGPSIYYDATTSNANQMDLASLDLDGNGTTDRVIITTRISSGPTAKALVMPVNPDSAVVSFSTNTGGAGNYIKYARGISIDNCPTVANPTQADSDNDGIGDACDTPSVTCALVPAGNGGFYTVTFGITNGTLVSAKIDGQAVNNWDLVKLTHSDTNYVKTNRMVGFNGLHINTNGPGTLTVIATNAYGTTTCQAFSAQTP